MEPMNNETSEGGNDPQRRPQVPSLSEGQRLLETARVDQAREVLEQILAAEGPSPVLLDALVACYDKLGESELAGEFRSLVTDLDPRPLTRDEHEGGPAMTDEMERNNEPEKGEGAEEAEEFSLDSALELDDTGDPAEALRELEALLQGAGTSLEGDVTGEEEPEAGEPAPVSGGEGDRSDIWKKIMEQAEAVEDGGEYSGIEELESLVNSDASAEERPVEREEEEMGEGEEIETETEAEAEAEAEIETEAETETETEAEAEAETEIEIETEAVTEVGDEAEKPPGEEPEIEEPGEEEEEAVAEEGEEEETGEEEEEEEEEGETLEVVGALEIESTDLSEDDRETETIEVVDALEIDSTEFAGPDTGPAGGVSKDDDAMVLGPVELSDEALEEAGEGIELDTGFDVLGESEETAELTEADIAEVGAMELDGDAALDVDEALKALEDELGGADQEAEPVEVGPENALEEDLDELGAQLEGDMSLDEIAEDEIGASVAGEDVAPGETVAESDAAADTEPAMAQVEAVPGSVQIATTDDSIKAAIQAEILVGQGHVKEAIRFFEALQLWDPERESFKKRLEDLRKMIQTE